MAHAVGGCRSIDALVAACGGPGPRATGDRAPRGPVLSALLIVCVIVLSGCSSSAPAQVQTGSQDFAGPVDIGGRRIYLQCRGPQQPGRPTVVLGYGLGGSGELWNVVEPGLDPPAEPVLPALARTERVCTYDRPGTLLPDQTLNTRSDTVPQPRTVADWSSELHATLTAAHVPGPYVLVGHSFSGLMARYYASTYPDEVAGLVLVDATSEKLRDLAPPAILAALDRADPPLPGLEHVRFSPNFDQVIAVSAAHPLRPNLPLTVVSAGLLDQLPSGADRPALEAAVRGSQDYLAHLLPGTRQIVAADSGHNIMFTEPGVIVDAVDSQLCQITGSGDCAPAATPAPFPFPGPG